MNENYRGVRAVNNDYHIGGGALLPPKHDFYLNGRRYTLRHHTKGGDLSRHTLFKTCPIPNPKDISIAGYCHIHGYKGILPNDLKSKEKAFQENQNYYDELTKFMYYFSQGLEKSVGSSGGIFYKSLAANLFMLNTLKIPERMFRPTEIVVDAVTTDKKYPVIVTSADLYIR
jgi:hypothetical protein